MWEKKKILVTKNVSNPLKEISSSYYVITSTGHLEMFCSWDQSLKFCYVVKEQIVVPTVWTN